MSSSPRKKRTCRRSGWAATCQSSASIRVLALLGTASSPAAATTSSAAATGPTGAAGGSAAGSPATALAGPPAAPVVVNAFHKSRGLSAPAMRSSDSARSNSRSRRPINSRRPRLSKARSASMELSSVTSKPSRLWGCCSAATSAAIANSRSGVGAGGDWGLGPSIVSPASRQELGRVRGIEPPTPGTTNRCSNQLSYTRRKGSLQSALNPTPADGQGRRKKGHVASFDGLRMKHRPAALSQVASRGYLGAHACRRPQGPEEQAQ